MTRDEYEVAKREYDRLTSAADKAFAAIRAEHERRLEELKLKLNDITIARDVFRQVFASVKMGLDPAKAAAVAIGSVKELPEGDFIEMIQLARTIELAEKAPLKPGEMVAIEATADEIAAIDAEVKP